MQNRREFLKYMAGLTASLSIPVSLTGNTGGARDRLGELLPTRKLGKTGEQITILGLGGWHIHWANERDSREVIMTALENGVRFFDTAENYGPNVSEIKFGKFLTPRSRDVIFLMTKSAATDAKTAREHLEGSLRRMKTDYLDLWQLHSLRNPEDVDARLDNGVLDVFLEAKEKGKVRFIGFTGHQNPAAFLRILERTGDMDIWDAAQMPVNPLDALHPHSFVRQAMPLLVEKQIGILAMKTLSNGRFFKSMNHSDTSTDTPLVPDVLSIADTQNFAWSLPISTLITGAENKAYLDEKILLARKFHGLSEKERENILTRITDPSIYQHLEHYKRI